MLTSCTSPGHPLFALTGFRIWGLSSLRLAEVLLRTERCNVGCMSCQIVRLLQPL